MRNVWMTAILVGGTAGAAMAQLDTGTMEYWDGDLPAKYIYNTVSENPVDTGSMEYFEDTLPAQYVYKTEAPAQDNTSIELSTGAGGGAGCSATVGAAGSGLKPPAGGLFLVLAALALARGRLAASTR